MLQVTIQAKAQLEQMNYSSLTVLGIREGG